MNDNEVRKLLKKGEIFNQYLLIGDEPLLIDNIIDTIKNALQVNESFDLDTFSISESQIEDIMPKLYLTPFASAKRLLILKNLEELNAKTLANLAKTINHTSSQNCLVMTYRIKKEEKTYGSLSNRITRLFKNATCVTFQQNKTLVRKWIMSKIQRDKLSLSPSMIHYLEEEFANDITGLKNEFEKIENYLCESKTLNMEGMKDLAKGLCDFSKYQIVDTFLKGGKETVELFEELRPYLRSYAEIVDALTRGLVYHVQKNSDRYKSNDTSIIDLLDKISQIDQRVKRSSYFAHLMLEIFFLKNTNLSRKGAVYGR